MCAAGTWRVFQGYNLFPALSALDNVAEKSWCSRAHAARSRVHALAPYSLRWGLSSVWITALQRSRVDNSSVSRSRARWRVARR